MTPSALKNQEGAQAFDLAPLTWVLPDLRKSLPLAVSLVRQFFSDSQSSDTRTPNSTQIASLQDGRRLFHQARSALEMIGLNTAAKLLIAAGDVVKAFSENPAHCTEEAVVALEKAQLAVLDYLDALLRGRRAEPLGLFPQYGALLQATDSQRIHPADLWGQDWSWRAIHQPSGAKPLEMTPRVKAQLGQALLRLLNTSESTAAAELRSACAGLAAVHGTAQAQSFCCLAAGFFEACEYRLIELDVYAKRTASQILQQLNALLNEGMVVSEKVALDTTFFCLCAKSEEAIETPFLSAVQIAYASLPAPHRHYNTPQFGKFDPVMIDFLRRRLSALSESWSALSGGELARGASVLDHLHAVGDTLHKLHPQSAMLVKTLGQVVETTTKLGAKPNPLLAMEVATTLLYLEAVYDDMDPSADAAGERMDVLARRLAQVSKGEPPPAVETWMEALYRRLSERQSLDSVTTELRVSLAAVEAALEKYLRDPLDSSILSVVSGHLSQMYGVFSVLGLQQASNAVFKIREILDSHVSTERRKRPIPLPVYEQIARSVSTMGFLIDMLNYQIAIAKEMFVYDTDAGEFMYLNGRRAGIAKIVLRITGKNKPATPGAPPALPAEKIVASSPEPYGHQESHSKVASTAPDEDDGAEILDIFLDEAASVLEDAKQVLPPLDSDPAAFEEMVLMRRAFHTLKGGARMVGLNAFGEAAWAFEQLMNQWMAENKQPSIQLLELIAQALAAFSDWSQAIKQGRTAHWTEAQFRACADAMRLDGNLLPLIRSQADTPSFASPPATADLPMANNRLESELAAVDQDQIVDFHLLPTTNDRYADAAMAVSVSPLDSPQALQVDTENDAGAALDFEFFNHLPSPVRAETPTVAQEAAPNFPEAFFAVFLSETSDWAERLLAQTQSWTADGAAISSRIAQDLAHSIRGNSAAVGVQAIAELAQAVEKALDHLQLSNQELVPHISLFQEAASVLFAMVRSCAEHRTVVPNAVLLAQLLAIQDAPGAIQPAQSAVDQPLLRDIRDSGDGSPISVPQQDSPVSPALTARPEFAVSKSSESKTSSLMRSEEEDPLESQDQLDLDLLPVFQEEGAELIPALGTALRNWVAQPPQGQHRASILRILHTLKGSSRLTGAFRLGELAHRMESDVEQLPGQGLTADQIEPFLMRFDRLQETFEGLASGAATQELEYQPNGLNQDKQPSGTGVHAPGEPALAVARPLPAPLSGLIRVRASVVERLVDEAGEVAVYRSRTESHLTKMGSALGDLSQTLDRLSLQLRELELQADMRIQSRNTKASDAAEQFDPLEFDRFTRLQEIARMMAEAVGDVSTVRRNVQTALSASQQDLEQQSRQLRELQRDLLRMRLVDIERIADRLYSVVRQAAKEIGKQVTLDLQGGKIEIDRSVLERMTPAFEHLLRNAVVHGIEETQQRIAAGKPSAGAIKILVSQEGNDIAIDISDDGKGLSLEGIRSKARKMGLISPGQELDQEATTKLLFTAGFSTAAQVTELAGRGIGLDVVLSEVNALGGRIETHSEEGQGTRFKLVLPLTTAVTQVLMFRTGSTRIGIPAGLVDTVIRASSEVLEAAYANGQLRTSQGQSIQFFGAGPLFQLKQEPADSKAKSLPVLMLRSAGQSLALHVDEVLGNREVVVKNMGPQLSRLAGLAGITVLASGETILIYNPIALAKVYGEDVLKSQSIAGQSGALVSAQVQAQAPLILVVDDALTVRRLIQRLLVREGYRVALAHDGVHALQVLEQQRPLMVLSDIEMPRMDGFELARSIRARAEYADLPIVMITSRIAQKHRDHAMSLGVNHYLGKPYSEQELLSLIRAQVESTGADDLLRQPLNV